MSSPLTERLDVLQKRPPILAPQPQPNPWHKFQQVRNASRFSLASPLQLDFLDYGGAEPAFHSRVTQSPFYAALLGQVRLSQNLTAQLRSLQQYYTILDD